MDLKLVQVDLNYILANFKAGGMFDISVKVDYQQEQIISINDQIKVRKIHPERNKLYTYLDIYKGELIGDVAFVFKVG